MISPLPSIEALLSSSSLESTSESDNANSDSELSSESSEPSSESNRFLSKRRTIPPSSTWEQIYATRTGRRGKEHFQRTSSQPLLVIQRALVHCIFFVRRLHGSSHSFRSLKRHHVEHTPYRAIRLGSSSRSSVCFENVATMSSLKPKIFAAEAFLRNSCTTEGKHDCKRLQRLRI